MSNREYKVAWLKLALHDLEEIVKYISKDNPETSVRIAEEIWQASLSLVHSPNRARPGRVPGTRELILPGLPFFIAFRVRDDSVQILRILHTSRKYPQL